MGLTDWIRGLRNKPVREEGLAAGTGLITGHLADDYRGSERSADVVCPSCRHRSTLTDVIDLVERRTHYHCENCRHRWVVATSGSRRSRG